MSKTADRVGVISVAVEEIQHYTDRPFESVELGECGDTFAEGDVAENCTERRMKGVGIPTGISSLSI